RHRLAFSNELLKHYTQTRCRTLNPLELRPSSLFRCSREDHIPWLQDFPTTIAPRGHLPMTLSPFSPAHSRYLKRPDRGVCCLAHRGPGCRPKLAFAYSPLGD